MSDDPFRDALIEAIASTSVMSPVTDADAIEAHPIIDAILDIAAFAVEMDEQRDALDGYTAMALPENVRTWLKERNARHAR